MIKIKEFWIGKHMSKKYKTAGGFKLIWRKVENGVYTKGTYSTLKKRFLYIRLKITYREKDTETRL